MTMTSSASARSNPAASLPDTAPAAARAIFALLRQIRGGTLDVQLPDGQMLHFGELPAQGSGHRAALRLVNWKVCAAALKSGDIGFAESYIAGDWTTPDLVALLELFIHNRDTIEALIYGTWWGSLAYRVRHLFNRNSRSGSAKNIHAHYDLGNRFYKLWLDPTMNYSSALFEGQEQRSMIEAQHAKVRRALRECGVAPGARVLEIGCGWGALAEAAAGEFGAQVTGVTLSTEQLAFAQERLQTQGLAARADLRLQDYRDIQDEPFDAIASIEMFEAVGREYWASFFQTLRDKLKPGGRACIQTITIRDDLFDRYVKSTDFIQQYIFPGGLLPSPTAFRAEVAKAGLTVVNELAFGADYVRTLRQWRADFMAKDPAVR